VSDVQATQQTTDDNEKISGLMKIFRVHVKEYASDTFTQKKKDPELMQELDKHLRYMEKSIKQLKKSSKRNKDKAKKMIEARTEENRNLLETIGELRD
jgi:hypothetical protein